MGQLNRKTKTIFILLFLLAVYTLSYFFVSEIYVGEIAGETIKIRLFQRKLTMHLYQPMTFLEKKVRKNTFDAQVHSGASLPPEKTYIEH